MRRFHAMKFEWGFSKLISKDSLIAPGNGFLVNDKCVIGAEVAVIKPHCISQYVSVRKLGHLYKREWNISGFSKLREAWKSEKFTIGDHKWYIYFHPNGDNREEGRSVSLFLCLVGTKSFSSHEKVKADWHMHIKNQLNDQHHSRNASRWFEPGPAYGWTAFMPLSDMRDPHKGFVVKDRCIVGVEISVTGVIS